jgi:hypothetical protein
VLRHVADSRAPTHRVAGSTTGSTNGLVREVDDSQLVDCRAKLSFVRDRSVVLPKQMRYQTAPCPVPARRDREGAGIVSGRLRHANLFGLLVRKS